MTRLPVMTLGFGLMLLGACGGSTTSPSSPTSATLNLTGTWSGMLGQPQSSTALRLTWTATQAGDTVIGPAVVVKPAVNIPVTGTLSGRLTGNQLALTFTIIPSGNAPPGALVCAATGSGSATATNTSISGSLNVLFTETCSESGLAQPGSDQFTLVR